MSKVDDILELLDGGLQSSAESGVVTDLGPDLCARCQRHRPPPASDLCTGCRAFLLGDADVDPCFKYRRIIVGIDVESTPGRRPRDPLPAPAPYLEPALQGLRSELEVRVEFELTAPDEVVVSRMSRIGRLWRAAMRREPADSGVFVHTFTPPVRLDDSVTISAIDDSATIDD